MKKYFALVLGGLCLFNSCGGGSPAPPPPTLRLAPASLSFGVAVVGTTSSAQVETLTNTGSSELAISGVAITGSDATDFNQIGTCESSLGAGANCTLNVTFTPSTLGQRNAAINITDDGAGSPQVLTLNGMGGDSGPNATLSATSLSFGNQLTDTTSAAQSITLSNYGTTELSITGITASTHFGETSTCNSTLASGASCTVSVTFTPSQLGNLNGTLSVADSAPDSPQIVSLSGSGVAGQCIPKGQECRPGLACCAGLTCRPASTRAFCEP